MKYVIWAGVACVEGQWPVSVYDPATQATLACVQKMFSATLLTLLYLFKYMYIVC